MNEEYLKDMGVNLDDSLNYLGDMDTYHEIIMDFVNEISDKVNQLNNYKLNDDMENYAIIAHSIKSDARYLGFASLADIALQHETAGKQDDKSYVNENYNDFIDKINYFIDVANKYLGK